ncbi:SpoIIE family protein phosphatase [Kineococcus rubinsiae]|uniref:SpoIIE family protein phosphatase n=1 Tax=Kineococcus rubinsiae TaxID=2609562 RepID=UPI0014304EEC|nr:SpoIIE family protein phosphatase [Kineococcus rubinsiae]
MSAPAGGQVLDVAHLFRALPTAYLVVDPDLVIVEANEAYLELLGRERGDLLGRWTFDAFPPAPDSLDDQGRNPLQLAFEEARDSGRTVPLPLFEYAVRDLATEQVLTRFWSLIICPLTSPEGDVVAVLQRVEDVTDYVLERRQARADVQLGRERVQAVEGDLYRRMQELQVAQGERERAVAQLARLSELAMALAAADTVAEVERTVVRAGSQVLGAESTTLVSRAEEAGRPAWRLSDGDGGSPGSVPHDSTLPVCETARAGRGPHRPGTSGPDGPTVRAVLGHDGRHPVTGSAEGSGDREESWWVVLPLTTGEQRLGCLAVSWSRDQRPSGVQEVLLQGFAAQCAQTLARLGAREVERRDAAEHRRMSAALQRALLTSPPESEHTQVVVRYQPAATAAQVGGDWYDAFVQPGGATVVVIGDVLGHDTFAAATMGQVRTVLRTIGVLDDESPASVLTKTDRAMAHLQLGTTATAIVARLEQDPDERREGLTQLRWSNAGHPPAMLLHPDGTVEVVSTEHADLLLGVVPDSARQETVHLLPREATLLLYTDGLVERRDQDLQQGLELLAQTLRELGADGPDLDTLVDRVLARMLPPQPEDDVAVIAVRLHRQDRPRPAAAGPQRDPGDVPPEAGP